MIHHHVKILIVIDYIPHTVHFITMTHLFCNWNFIPLNLPYLFFSSPNPIPLEITCLFSASITISVLLHLFICFVFLNSPYKWNHTVFVFVWLYSLSIMPSRSIHVVTNGKISFFSWLSNIPLWIYVSSLSSHLSWALKLLPHLSYH